MKTTSKLLIKGGRVIDPASGFDAIADLALAKRKPVVVMKVGSSELGAKVARPEATVLHVLGDAAFGQCGMDLETAARNKIGTVTILLNNSCLGGYDKYLHVATERYGTRFLSGSYSKVADGLGARTEVVEKPAEIIPAVQRALAAADHGRPALLEVISKEEPVFSK